MEEWIGIYTDGGCAVRYQRALCLIVFVMGMILFFLPAGCGSAAADTGFDACMEDFMASADETGKPAILYIGTSKISMNMRSEPDTESASLGLLNEKDSVQIFGFDQDWLFCWSDEVGIYFVRRHNVDAIEPVSEEVAPYGVIPNRFVAVTAADTVLRASPDAEAEALDSYPADTRISLWHITDGWATVPYKRVVGYLYVGDLKELEPVAPSVQEAREGDILAAFTTFYSVKNTELNIGRMENIRVGCGYIDNTYQPGEEFDFNAIAGPYRRSRGYMPSPVLIDGSSVEGYGGGTCQVSTTLYNVLLQLPEGITVLYRRPHGPSGATYAPHGVDAAFGRNASEGSLALNLIFRNDFDFPITIESTVQNGSLCICIRKGSV